ncbi:helix-turn-helix domain-containing protein [Polluticoccus soli]|uniref:helix-turn-helix domain-containing protein n=1 Tax=Polluticoccus soli TaxID=3034150 RepID=UPI0023E205B1|nr:helix-turn-helix transcriptional regulator [Flavipsychrobacter sp. JY13-12]
MPISKAQREYLVRLGERVKSLRLAKNFTLEQLAHAVDKDKQSVHRLEKGNINPSFLYLKDICKGLNIEMSELIDGL